MACVLRHGHGPTSGHTPFNTVSARPTHGDPLQQPRAVGGGGGGRAPRPRLTDVAGGDPQSGTGAHRRSSQGGTRARRGPGGAHQSRPASTAGVRRPPAAHFLLRPQVWKRPPRMHLQLLPQRLQRQVPLPQQSCGRASHELPRRMHERL